MAVWGHGHGVAYAVDSTCLDFPTDRTAASYSRHLVTNIISHLFTRDQIQNANCKDDDQWIIQTRMVCFQPGKLLSMYNGDHVIYNEETK